MCEPIENIAEFLTEIRPMIFEESGLSCDELRHLAKTLLPLITQLLQFIKDNKQQPSLCDNATWDWAVKAKAFYMHLDRALNAECLQVEYQCYLDELIKTLDTSPPDSSKTAEAAEQQTSSTSLVSEKIDKIVVLVP